MVKKIDVREVEINLDNCNDVEYVVNHLRKIKYINKSCNKNGRSKIVKILR